MRNIAAVAVALTLATVVSGVAHAQQNPGSVDTQRVINEADRQDNSEWGWLGLLGLAGLLGLKRRDREETVSRTANPARL